MTAALVYTQAPITIVAYGRPAPQGSKTRKGRAMVEASQYVVPWREAVKAAVLATFGRMPDPITGPVAVRMVFTLDRARSHYLTGRNTSHLLRSGAPARPTGTPDLDKLARSTGDALTDVRLLRDDSLIVEYDRLAKVYVGEDPEALAAPGVRITVRQVTR